jgi:hypothetical protein
MVMDEDKFIDDGMEQAGMKTKDAEQTEEAGQQQTETPEKQDDSAVDTASKSTGEDDSEQAEQPSQVESLLDTEQDTETEEETEEKSTTQVPVSALQKERQRRREAEQRAKELEQQSNQSPPDGEKSDVDSILDGDDDDWLTRGEVKQALQTIKGQDQQPQNQQQLAEQVKSLIQQERQRDQIQQTKQKAISSEQQIRKEYKDYDKIVGTARELNLLNDNDRQKAFASDNPAKSLYEISKQKITNVSSALGIQQPSKEETPSKEQTETEGEQPAEDINEDIFNDVWGSPPKEE